MPATPPPLPEMLDRLIATPSVSAVKPEWDMSNLDIIHLLAEWCEALEFTVTIHNISPSKANLIARRGPERGRGLILSGHTDTVPYDEGLWTSDPFTARRAAGRLYGLGACDMKSFLAIALEAARRVDLGRLAAPLTILATADEESSMAGARALVEDGAVAPHARYAVIGEPTALRPVRMHKGILMEAVRLRGQSGHSSDPALGRSALEGMHAVMRAILDWRAELQARHTDPAFAVPVPTMNLGHIHGGDNPNRICADCELHLDLRPLPGMAIDELRQELRCRAERAVADSGLEVLTRPLFPGIPPMRTAADATLVKTAEKLTGHKAEAVAFATEAPYLQKICDEVIVLGPGSIQQAHQPDEYLPLAQLEPTVELLRGLIAEVCLDGGG